MKTYKKLYPQVVAWDNVMWAYEKARLGKRRTPAAAAFEFALERYLVELHRELHDQTYQPGPYHSFYIHEPKRRLISVGLLLF